MTRERRTTSGKDDRSLAQLFSDLRQQLTRLIRDEIRLAKTEVTSNATKMARGAAMAAAGGAVAYAGFIVLLFAGVYALVALGLAAWLSALLVALVVIAVGGVLVWQGVSRLREARVVPTTTVETVRDDVEAVKEQVK